MVFDGAVVLRTRSQANIPLAVRCPVSSLIVSAGIVVVLGGWPNRSQSVGRLCHAAALRRR